MATVAVAAPPSVTQHLPRPYQFNVAQYLKMSGDGVFGPEVKVELIRGLVVQKMTRYAPHDGVLARMTRWLTALLTIEWSLRCQLGLILADSVPEPDLAIVRGPEGIYLCRHPRAADAVLAVEVAHSTLDYDREVKGPLYAEARIPEYWIVNIVDLQVEVYMQPRGGKSPGYRQRQDYSGRKSVPLILGGLEIAKLSVADLFDGLATQEVK